MKALWKSGTATAVDLQKAVADETPLRDSTIRTVLLRLEEKGYVRHEVNGRTFVYSCLEGDIDASNVKCHRDVARRAVQPDAPSTTGGKFRKQVGDDRFLASLASSRMDSRVITLPPPFRRTP